MSALPALKAPATGFAGAIIDWQRKAGRHDLPWQNTRDPYRIWLAEVMKASRAACASSIVNARSSSLSP